jgi:hypothetical protein
MVHTANQSMLKIPIMNKCSVTKQIQILIPDIIYTNSVYEHTFTLEKNVAQPLLLWAKQHIIMKGYLVMDDAHNTLDRKNLQTHLQRHRNCTLY